MNGVQNFTGTYEAQAPISHGSDEDFGMEIRLRTLEITVRDNGDLYHEDVPVVSGNSLRGQLRDLLAEDLLDRVSEDDEPLEVSDTLSNALYAGGSLERSAGPGKINRRLIHDIRETVPPLSLLGTAIGDQLIEGRVDMGQLLPVAMETNSYTGRNAEQSVFEFVDETFYTRQDDRVGGRQQDEDAQQMKFDVQVLVPGVRLHHDLTLRSGHTDLDAACLGHAFDLFAERPVIGGMAARGHGTVEFDYADDLPDGKPYREWVADNRDEIREFVADLDDRVN
jgi:CRISPR/Cas system CSM-associated protein Csm3 (group 7 of RAMP superfamily)